MPNFQVLVTITTDTIEHAELVVTERTGYDEILRDENGVVFDYTILPGSVTASPATDEEVLDALPRTGESIPFGDLVERLHTEDRSPVRESLLRLERVGLASMVMGRGWKRTL